MFRQTATKKHALGRVSATGNGIGSPGGPSEGLRTVRLGLLSPNILPSLSRER